MYSDSFEGPPGDRAGSESDGSGSRKDEKSRCSPAAEVKGRFTLDEVTDLTQANGKDLVRPCDIRGILHSHSRYADGAHPLESMVEIAREIGLEYLGVSDHFLTAAHPDGMGLPAVETQRREIDQLNARYGDFELLQGVELDANPDGTLPLDDNSLALFDYVIVSFPPTDGKYSPTDLTEQMARVAANPRVTILGRPVGDCILRCRDELLDMERILKAAVVGRTAVELNANPSAVELDWSCLRKAQELGVYLAISPDAHRAARLVDYRHGAEMAHEAGISCSSILNTMPVADLRRYLAGD